MLSLYFLLETHSEILSMQHCIEDIEGFLNKVDVNDIMWSPKIDGVRVRAIIDKRTIKDRSGFRKIASVKYYSRNEKELKNFDVDKDIIELAHTLNRKYNIKYPIAFDLEVTGPENKIYDVMTQLRRQKNIDPSIFKYYLFDIVLDKPLNDRQNLLDKSFSETTLVKLNKIPFYDFKDFSVKKLDELVTEKIKENYEGVVLFNKKSNYFFGRTKDCCKCKQYKTIDLKIVDIKPGAGKYSNMLGSFIVEYKNKKLSISGRLNVEQRKYYFKDPPIGKTIEIRYQEETKDGYLRKPIFVRFRPDKD